MANTGIRQLTTNVGGVIKRIWYALNGTTPTVELMSIDDVGNFKNTGTMTVGGLSGTGNRSVMTAANGLTFTQGYQQVQTGYNLSSNGTSVELGATNNDCVNGTLPYKWRQFVQGNASAGQNQFFQCYKNGGSGWENIAWMTAGGMGVVALSGTGNRAVYSDANGFLTNTSSDERVKKNIKNLSDTINILDSLKKIRGVVYNWDTSIEGYENMGEQEEIGVIAQEIEQHIPQIVGENSTGYKSVDYAKLTAYLIEVNKALLDKMEILESKVV